MNRKRMWLAGTSLLGVCLVWGGRRISGEPVQAQVVRLAELEIDPAQLDRYRAALREEIETSIRVEPGVLRLYAVSVKDHPAQIRLFEMYASTEAYKAHIETPHFRKYKSATEGMVTSLRLLEADPILLGSK